MDRRRILHADQSRKPKNLYEYLHTLSNTSPNALRPIRPADERPAHRRHLLVLRVFRKLVSVGLFQGLELQTAQTENRPDAIKMGSAERKLEKLMYERLTEVRPLDFIILALMALAILFEAITYYELNEVRSELHTIEIEVNH